jgi:hypothetical protein
MRDWPELPVISAESAEQLETAFIRAYSFPLL